MTAEAPSRIALAVHLASGPQYIPLDRIHRVVGYATLDGQAEDYFLGWLTLHGDRIPVFDLNRVVCEQPTPECFGSRIAVVETPAQAPVRLIGLLAPGLTDTLSPDDPGRATAQLLDADNWLPMLYPFLPSAVPEGA
jgi:chemotaxis signal transduction protein